MNMEHSLQYHKTHPPSLRPLFSMYCVIIMNQTALLVHTSKVCVTFITRVLLSVSGLILDYIAHIN